MTRTAPIRSGPFRHRSTPRPAWAGSRRLARPRPGPGLAAAALGGALLVLGCGGQAVIDPEIETTTASGGTGPTTSTVTTSSTTSSGGSGGSGGTYVPPVDALVQTELGLVAPGEEVTFDAPPGLLGMTALAEIPSEYSIVGVEQVVAPNGTALVEDFLIEDSMWEFQNYGLVAAAVPQTDHAEAMPILSGPWSFTGYSEFSGAPVEMSVWTRQTVDGAFHGGVIDVNVFRVPSAASEDYLRGIVARAFDGFAGLDLGQLTFYPLSEQFAVIDEYNAWEVFLRTAQAEGRPALNVMVVRDFGGELVGAGGFSVGQPGFPLRHGTLLSGVVMLSYDDDFDVLVLRHETGHLSGVYHTSEIEAGGYQDHLADTPFCDDPWNQMESCPDFDNLMFPIAGSMQMQLSAGQQRIVQGSLIYRAIVQAGDPPVPPLGPEPLGGDDEQGASAPADDDGGWRSTRPAAPTAEALARPSAEPWAAELPPALAAALFGHFDPAWGGPSPFAALGRLARGDRELLWSVGHDARAPLRVRMRALVTIGHLAPDGEWRRRLARLAVARLAPERARVGALRALEAADAPELRSVAAALEGDAKPLVRQVARHLRDRR